MTNEPVSLHDKIWSSPCLLKWYDASDARCRRCHQTLTSIHKRWPVNSMGRSVSCIWRSMGTLPWNFDPVNQYSGSAGYGGRCCRSETEVCCLSGICYSVGDICCGTGCAPKAGPGCFMCSGSSDPCPATWACCDSTCMDPTNECCISARQGIVCPCCNGVCMNLGGPIRDVCCPDGSICCRITFSHQSK